jgi:hypothetical protein
VGLEARQSSVLFGPADSGVLNQPVSLLENNSKSSNGITMITAPEIATNDFSYAITVNMNSMSNPSEMAAFGKCHTHWGMASILLLFGCG